MTSYDCSFCDKKFHYKRFFDNHRIACEFFNQTKKLQNFDDDDNIPSQRDMFKLLQHLSLKCHNLTEDVEKLKKCAFSSNKKTIGSILCSIKPVTTLDEWVKTITVSNECITEIFNKSLTDGIIKCLSDRIEYEDINFILPILAFKGVLYVYTDDEDNTKWDICSVNKFNSIIEIIKHEIVKFYCNWKEKQPSVDCEIEMVHVTKITGLRINRNKQNIDVKSWLASRINYND